MRFRIIYYLPVFTFFLSCSDYLNNPVDKNSPDYEKPRIFIISTNITFNDSTAADLVTVVVSGNRKEVDIRYKLDNDTWTSWHAPDTVSVSVPDSGKHTITIEGRYGKGGEIVDTVLSFYRVLCPLIVQDTTDLNTVSDTTLEILHGSICTLTVNAAGTNPLTYKWYQDSVCIDSTKGDTLIIKDFQQSDTGNYYCMVSNKWCRTSTDTTFLKYLSPVQYAPESQPDSFVLNEDDCLLVNAADGLLKNDSDKNNDILTVVLSDSTVHGTLNLNSDGSFTYKPDQDFFGIDSFSYRAKDSREFSEETRVTLTVNSINDPPVVAKNSGITVQEEGTAGIDSSNLSITDVDHKASEIIFTLISEPKHGELKKNDAAITKSGTFTQNDIDNKTIGYYHDGSETRKDTVLFSVKDGDGINLDSILVKIEITPVNDTPYIQTENPLSIAENGIKVIGNNVLLVKDNDNTADEITFSLVKLPVNGVLLKQGDELDVGATFTQEDIDSQRISYQHNGGNASKDSLSFTIEDKAGAGISETFFKINIGLTDDPPVAFDDLDISVNEDSNILLTLVANDPEEMPVVSYEIVSSPRHGTLTGTGNKRTYTPALNFNGTDTITFRASDGNNWSNVATIVITIIPQNDKPEWKHQNVNLEVKEGKTVTLDLNTVFDSDPDGDQVSFSRKSGPGIINSDASMWSWTPDYSAAHSSPATCIITATDNGTPAMSSDITLTVTVTDSFCVLDTKVLSGAGSGTITVSPEAVTGASHDPNTVVTLTANEETDYVFKNWSGDIGDADPINSSIEITLDKNKEISAIFVKAAETVMLNIGESYVHGLIYAEGYFFASTRTNPAKLLRFNANNLADFAEITFSPGHGDANQLVYVPSKRKIYVLFGLNTKTIAEVDPFTMEHMDDKIVDPNEEPSPYNESGQSITTDNDYLYVITCSGAGSTNIIKYSLGDYSMAKTVTLPSQYTYGHAIRYANGALFATGAATPPWVVKLKTSDLSFEGGQVFSEGKIATDEFAFSDRYMFIGLETTIHDQLSGAIFRIDTSDVTHPPYIIETGAKGDVNSTGDYNGQCYAVQENDNYIWALFATLPGILTRIDPVSLSVQNYQLEHNIPNEISWDGKRLFITFWGQDPGRVQAFEPSYLNGREIP